MVAILSASLLVLEGEALLIMYVVDESEGLLNRSSSWLIKMVIVWLVLVQISKGPICVVEPRLDSFW